MAVDFDDAVAYPNEPRGEPTCRRIMSTIIRARSRLQDTRARRSGITRSRYGSSSSNSSITTGEAKDLPYESVYL